MAKKKSKKKGRRGGGHTHRGSGSRTPVTRTPPREQPESEDPVGLVDSDPAFGSTLSERMLAGVENLLAQKKFESAEEINEFLSTLDGSALDDLSTKASDDPKEQAQQLAYDAMEAPSAKEALRLARSALKLDPDCVDARCVVADETRSDAKRLQLLAEAVEAGERSLGPDFFVENKGHFWGIIETRPYMRARSSLAEALMVAGRCLEGMQHWEQMLELCPNDNLGIRHELLSAYLSTDHVEKARDLLEAYAWDEFAICSWANVLVQYLLRDFDAAIESLETARARNPYVEPFLLNEKQLPTSRPEAYQPGKESEAVICGHTLLAPWSIHPTAIAWLRYGGRPGDGRYCGMMTDLTK